MPRLLTVLILFVPLVCSATIEQAIPLGNRSYDVFRIAPGASSHTFSIEVVSADRLMIDISTPATPVDVSIVRPDGTVVDSAVLDHFFVEADEQPPLGAILFNEGQHSQLTLESPEDGAWTINVVLPSGATSTDGVISVIMVGGLQIGATASRPHYFQGHPAVLVAPLLNGSEPVLNANVSADIYQSGSAVIVQTVTLHDDGNLPDTESGDGLYTSSVAGLIPGNYLARVNANAGGQQVAASTAFEVMSPIGRFDGTFSDAGVDTNGDGLFERIDLAVGVEIEKAGTYRVVGALGRDDGQEVRGGAHFDLEAGSSTVSIPFSAEAVKTYLADDGPYRIKDLGLTRLPADSGQRDILVDQWSDLGVTQVYNLSQLQRPITLVLDGMREDAIDTNGNSFYDHLDIAFEVDTLRSGYYTWSGNLKSADGAVVAVDSNRRFLPVGTTEIGFSFEGQRIGEAGTDGPYIVGDIAVYGPPEAASVLEELGETSPYLASQFEGGAVSLGNLIRQVEALVITGVGGKPRAEGIRTSLLKKLNNAQIRQEEGHSRAALNLLEAFLNELEAQRGKRIDSHDADRLVELTERLAIRL